MAGITEVAELAGVSTATVSRALSGNGHVSAATRERVRRCGRRARLRGLIERLKPCNRSHQERRRRDPVSQSLVLRLVVEGAEQALLSHGYDPTLHNLSGGGDERRRVFEHFLLRKRVAAVIAVSLEPTPNEVTRLLDHGKPLVGIGGPLPGVRALSVDDIAVARLATEHLLSLGQRSIAHIGGTKESEMDFHLPTNRRIGYKTALEAFGISVDPELFEAADFTRQGGYNAAKQLFGNPRRRPTAVFGASDEMAIGAMLAARDMGMSVPADMSIMGIDDHALSEFFGLRTVAQYPNKQGRKAVEILMDQLHPGTREKGSLNTPLAFDFIVRSSTARPH